MRADAVRNLDTLMRTGARVLAADPAASIAQIAAEAGMDRRTVYRRFATREAMLLALFEAKLDGYEQVMDQARLTEAPVAVALHRYVEGILPVTREWPVEFYCLDTDDEAMQRRRAGLRARLDAFVDRCVAEGLVRPGLPSGWVRHTLGDLVRRAAHDYARIPAPQAADLVVETLLRGAGTR